MAQRTNAPGIPQNLSAVQVGQMWEANAKRWTELGRQGLDVFRDRVNTPAFLRMLPPVEGLRGLDIGCGEGYNTRLVADRGAKMVGFDISPTFVRACAMAERGRNGAIRYHVGSALELPFGDAVFDFAIATMTYMDVPDRPKALAETCRVLRPGGFLQFSISHPCFTAPSRKWAKDKHGRKIGLVCSQYFDAPPVEQLDWMFGMTDGAVTGGVENFQSVRFIRILSSWLNLVIDSGFRIERVDEPCPDEQSVREFPRLLLARSLPLSLLVLCRKP